MPPILNVKFGQKNNQGQNSQGQISQRQQILQGQNPQGQQIPQGPQGYYAIQNLLSL